MTGGVLSRAQDREGLPDANARFQALNGWYDTGDIALVDQERYITIKGRLEAISKVSGEMVSLTAWC